MSLSLSIGTKVLTQLPFVLKLQMPPSDRGGRGYSNKHTRKLNEDMYDLSS